MKTYKIYCKLIVLKAVKLSAVSKKPNILNIHAVYRYYLRKGFNKFKP